MNKLHEALKNEELMLEVGRKATEEQLNQIEIAGVKLKTGKTLECDTPQCKEYVRLAQQSTVEERKDKLYEMFAEFEIRPLVADFIKVHKYMESELQLAEQKVRENVTFNDL